MPGVRKRLRLPLWLCLVALAARGPVLLLLRDDVRMLIGILQHQRAQGFLGVL